MRDDQLRTAARERLGDRAFFAKSHVNDAGIFFGTNKAKRLVAVIHVDQVVVMSEAFSDDAFDRFVSTLMDWATAVLALLDAGVDVDDAIDETQQAISDSDPDGYALIDFVFDL